MLYFSVLRLRNNSLDCVFSRSLAAQDFPGCSCLHRHLLVPDPSFVRRLCYQQVWAFLILSSKGQRNTFAKAMAFNVVSRQLLQTLSLIYNIMVTVIKLTLAESRYARCKHSLNGSPQNTRSILRIAAKKENQVTIRFMPNRRPVYFTRLRLGANLYLSISRDS